MLDGLRESRDALEWRVTQTKAQLIVMRSAAEGKEASAIEGRTRFAFTTRDGLRGGAPILLAYKPFY